MKSCSASEAVSVLSAERLLVVSHVNPDADALGSSGALILLLRSLGKQVECINQDGVPAALQGMLSGIKVHQSIPEGRWQGVVSCDCADPERVGKKLLSALGDLRFLLNIDHHISNTFFAEHNFVDGAASSTAEMIFRLLPTLTVELEQDVAQLLFAGIMADTGSFRYSSVTAQTFAVAADLVRAGASPERAGRYLFGSRSEASVRLHAAALGRLVRYCDGAIAQVVVTKEMMEECCAKGEDCENLVEAARDIDGVELAFFIRYYEEGWKVSLRAMESSVDVSQIAAEFSGGGHRQAAAFRWRGQLEELIERLSGRLKKALTDKQECEE